MPRPYKQGLLGYNTRMLSYAEARALVVAQTTQSSRNVATLPKKITDALGDVLAREIHSDRDYPPFNRSTRDGYAVRASEASTGTSLPCVGEIKAGDTVTQPLAPQACVQIMTGAAVPAGANAVVMIEFTDRAGDKVTFQRATAAGQNIVQRGSEARAGEVALRPGLRLGYAELALAAQVGAAEIPCAKRPRVAILSTGDEVVPVTETPGPFHIRNSNSVSLVAQVRLAGGEPVPLGNAFDRVDDLSANTSIELRRNDNKDWHDHRREHCDWCERWSVHVLVGSKRYADGGPDWQFVLDHRRHLHQRVSDCRWV